MSGKNGIVVTLATAALELPEEIVRKALYQVVGHRQMVITGAEKPGTLTGRFHLGRYGWMMRSSR